MQRKKHFLSRVILFNPDGKLAWYSSDPAGPFAASQVGGTVPQFEPGPLDGLCALAASADSTTLAGGTCKGTVLVWRTDSGKLLATLSGHRMPVWALAFSPDGKVLASGSDDRSVRMWSAGQEYPELP